MQRVSKAGDIIMSANNEDYFAWRKILDPVDRALMRANANAANAMGAIRQDLNAGRPREARLGLPALRIALDEQRRAVDELIATIDQEVPNQRL